MKYILSLLIAICISNASVGQSKINIYGGWTPSKILVYATEELRQRTYFSDLYRLPVYHSPYFALNYEYTHKSFVFTTGLSCFVLGTSEFFLADHSMAMMYINIPLFGGHKWNFSKGWGLKIEGGAEVGVGALNMGLVTFLSTANQTRMNVNLTLGVEGEWKRLRFGTRVQVGVTDYQEVGPSPTARGVLRHSAITTYIGYTLWDSVKAKERRKKRLNKI